MGGPSIYPGEVFGKLTAVARRDKATRSGRLRPHWLCKCECGGAVVVESSNLRSGNSTQCATCANASRGVNRATHGHTRGRSTTKVYRTWQSMLARCENPANKRYADYGGRGITVHPYWHDFTLFLQDMGEPPTPDHQIDRKNNSLGYAPGNCVWATRKQQGRNKRTNVILDYGGKKQTLVEWCEDLGLKYGTVKRRLHQGWSTEDALQGGDLRRVEPSRTTVT